MQQDIIDNNLINRIQHAFSRSENCCDYLFEVSDGMDYKFGLLSYEFSAAQCGVKSMLRDGSWTDQSARKDVLYMLRKAESVVEIAGLPFVRREIAALIKDVEELSH